MLKTNGYQTLSFGNKAAILVMGKSRHLRGPVLRLGAQKATQREREGERGREGGRESAYANGPEKRSSLSKHKDPTNNDFWYPPLYWASGARMSDPYVYVVSWVAKNKTLIFRLFETRWRVAEDSR